MKKTSKHLNFYLETSRVISLIILITFFSAGLQCKSKYASKEESKKNTGGLQGGSLNNDTLYPRDIYKPVVIYDAPANESTVISTKDGQIKIFFINNPGDADKMMSISSPNGIDWSTQKKEFDLPGNAYYANFVLEDEAGSLHCVFHIRGEGDNGYNGRHYNMWYNRKMAGATEWEAPKELYHGYVGSIRNFMQLKSGRLLTAFEKAVPERSKKPANNEKDFGWNDVMVMYSDDNGDTWDSADNTLKIEIDSDKTTRYGAVEPVVVQLKNDVLWMLIRTNKGVLYESFSHDSGKKWSNPEPSRFISSDSPAQFLRLKDGRLILFLSMNQRWDDPNSYAFGGREVLHAAISEDDGRTWKGFREVLRAVDEKGPVKSDRGTAYPSAAETTYGKVVLVSGQGVSRSVVMFDPDWLLEDNVKGDIPIDPAEWTLYESGDIVSKEYLEEEQKIRFLAGPAGDYHQNPEVVWNFPALTSGEMRMEIEFVNKCPKLDLSLADHFSISGDSVASEYSVLSFNIDNNYPKQKKIPVRIKWETDNRTAELYIFDKKISTASFDRIPVFGINYLRAGMPAGTGEERRGFILNSIEIK